MAGALIVALAVVGIARLALGARGAKPGSATHPLAPFVITLPFSAGYCPSVPAWSPDGKYLAVIVKSAQPGGDGWCYPYSDLVSSSAAQGLQANGYQGQFAWDATVLVLDARTDAIVQRLTPPDPTSIFCQGVSNCAANLFAPTSLSWSPDGSSVLLFTALAMELDDSSGRQFNQVRRVLDVLPASGAGNLRLLSVFGRKVIVQNDIQAVNLYSAPLFNVSFG